VGAFTFGLLCIDALTEINALTPGAPIAAADMQLALTRGNAFIDSANAQSLMLNVTRLDAFTLPTSAQSYTVGPGGALDLPYRPNDILACAVVDNTQSPPVFIHMTMVPADIWEAYNVVGFNTSVPTQAWYEKTYPLGTLWIRGIPTNLTYQLRIQTKQLIGQAASIGTTFLGPPGWYEAFMYSLAERLCNPFGKIGDIKQDITARAAKARANFKASNGEIILMELDGLKTGNSSRVGWNWILGPFLQ
jgi:hypothetical protein